MTWSWKGIFKRALEFAGGSIVAVAPVNRARIRYNEIKQQLEQSISTGPWGPLGTGSSAVVSQPEWYISPSTGSDDNDGATAATALATHAELMRRIGDAPIDSSVTVYITENLDEDLYVRLQVTRNGFVRYVGTVSTLASGTFTNVVNTTPAANQPGEVEDLALSGDWGPLGLINKRIRTTGGTNPDSVTWLAKDLGAKTARVGNWIIVPYTTPMNFVNPNTVAIGDPYVVEELPTIKSVTVDLFGISESGAFPESTSRIVFDSVSILGGSPPTQYDYLKSTGNVSNGTWFIKSELERYEGLENQPAPAVAVACFAPDWQGPGVLNACVCTGGVGLGEGSAIVSTLFTDCAYTDLNPGLRLNFIINSGFMDCADDGISMFSGTYLRGFLIWGTGNAGYGFDVGEGGFADLDAATTTLTGTSGDTRVGGIVTPYAGLPFVNPANLAQIQV